MIRRLLSDNRYLLIRQPEHARVAFEIARIWNCDWLNRFSLRTELMRAIESHDDGWTDWERSPDLEPGSQLPRSFTEMEVAASVEISRKSIQLGMNSSTETGFWISQHFHRLASQRRSSEGMTSEDTEILDGFLAEQNMLQTEVLCDSQREASNQELLLGTEWLRFFDHVSLLLCCRLPDQPDTIIAPNDVETTIQQTRTDDLSIDVEFSAGLTTELSICASAGIFRPEKTTQIVADSVHIRFQLKPAATSERKTL